jgi:glycosyltransferase involved in cell wall biosynthesis
VNLVSVIIPAYHKPEYLLDAVKSALEQDYPEKEVVVVNDGSPHDLEDALKPYLDRIVYLAQENKGVSAGRNLGIRASRGTYLAFLDSDDVLLPGSVKARATYLDGHPDTGLVCGDGIMFQGDKVVGLRSVLWNKPRQPENFRWETVDYNPNTSTTMVRRECFKKVELFEESIRAAEDWLMWVRLSLHYDMAYLPVPLVRYRRHEDNISKDRASIDAGHRIAVRKVVEAPYFKNYPAHFRARLLFFRAATAWWVEPKTAPLGFLLRAVLTDFTQSPYALTLLRRGLTNALRRRQAGGTSR